MQLYNEPVTVTSRSRSGLPGTVAWRGTQLEVDTVREIWQAPGETQVLRVGVRMNGGRRAIAELAIEPGTVRLRYLWV